MQIIQSDFNINLSAISQHQSTETTMRTKSQNILSVTLWENKKNFLYANFPVFIMFFYHLLINTIPVYICLLYSIL